MGDFFNLMPKILPRYYTVASSNMKKENEFEIIISQVNWTGGDNKENRMGLTSAYYNNLHNDFKLKTEVAEGDESINKQFTKIIIKDSFFRLPKETNSPILLFATGTGVAPYIGFMQELEIRKKLGENENNTVMFFGSKNKNYDFIYENEITNWNKEKIIENLFLAFSRDQEQKNYIQDVFVKNIDLVKNNLEGCFIYVCGGVSMGNSLHNELENNLGKEFMQKLEKEKRYIKEFWGKE